ncbi:MAG: MoaD/ThiS family protein [Candidatus Bathyarchaeia archaeon]
MIVDVRLFGIFKESFGSDRISLTVDAPKRLREIVMEITRSSPALQRVLIDPELQDPRPNAIILVNGKEIGVLSGLETDINDGDRIVLIPVTHGG